MQALVTYQYQYSDFVEVASSNIAPWQDRGLLYGDGYFTTMRAHAQHIVLWPWHLQRLQHGAHVLALSVDWQAFEQALHQLLLQHPRFNESAVCIKIIVTRGREGQGYLGTVGARPVIYVQVFALNTHTPLKNLNVGVHAYDLACVSPVLAGLKSLSRIDQVLLSQQLAATAFDEFLIVNSQQQVVEAIKSNVFFVINGQYVTPTINRQGVNGVARQALLKHLADYGQPVVQRDVHVDELAQAQALFLTNALRGIQWIGCITYNDKVLRFDGDNEYKNHPWVCAFQQPFLE